MSRLVVLNTFLFSSSSVSIYFQPTTLSPLPHNSMLDPPPLRHPETPRHPLGQTLCMGTMTIKVTTCKYHRWSSFTEVITFQVLKRNTGFGYAFHCIFATRSNSFVILFLYHSHAHRLSYTCCDINI